MTTNATDIGLEPVDVDKADTEDLTLWSVTTIIGVIDKSGPLKYWAAGMAADAAIDDEPVWKALLERRGRKEARKWLRDSFTRPARNQLAATDLGTVVHDVCENYALTGTRPDEGYIEHAIADKVGEHVDMDNERDTVTAMLDQFDDWLQRFTPSYQATEVTVYSPTYGYAGQADCFLTVGGVRFLGDYKTSREPFDSYGKPRTPYPEQVGLQLAAYRYAEFAAVWRPRRIEKFKRRYYLLGPAERVLAVPVPEVDTGLVIQITPESCEAYPIRCDEPVHTAFLYTQEEFRWVNEISKTVMGAPLQ